MSLLDISRFSMLLTLIKSLLKKNIACSLLLYKYSSKKAGCCSEQRQHLCQFYKIKNANSAMLVECAENQKKKIKNFQFDFKQLTPHHWTKSYK